MRSSQWNNCTHFDICAHVAIIIDGCASMKYILWAFSWLRWRFHAPHSPVTGIFQKQHKKNESEVLTHSLSAAYNMFGTFNYWIKSARRHSNKWNISCSTICIGFTTHASCMFTFCQKHTFNHFLRNFLHDSRLNESVMKQWTYSTKKFVVLVFYTF